VLKYDGGRWAENLEIILGIKKVIMFVIIVEGNEGN